MKTGCTAVTIWFFRDPSTVVYLLSSDWFCQNLLVTSAFSWSVPIVGGKLPGLCGGTNTYPVCYIYLSAIFFHVRCLCLPPLSFDSMDAVFYWIIDVHLSILLFLVICQYLEVWVSRSLLGLPLCCLSPLIFSLALLVGLMEGSSRQTTHIVCWIDRNNYIDAIVMLILTVD